MQVNVIGMVLQADNKQWKGFSTKEVGHQKENSKCGFG